MRWILFRIPWTRIVGPFVLAMNLGAAGSPRSLEAVLTLDPEEVTVGDPIRATLEIVLDPGFRLQAPEIPRVLGRFSVGEIPEPELSRGRDGRTRITYRFDVTVFRPGRQTLPSIRLQGEDEESGMALFEDTSPVTLRVASVLEGPVREIADIKDVASLPAGGSYWWLLGVFLALGAVAYRAFRKRPIPVPVPVPTPPAPVVPAHEWAYRRLRELLSSPLLSRGKTKKFYIELAEIIKEYLNRRFGIVTAERTTDELMGSLGTNRETQPTLPGCRQILTRCDLVKFARLRPGDPESRSVVDLAFRLVAESREPVADTPLHAHGKDSPRSAGP